MAIQAIEINTHRYILGANDNEHRAYADQLRNLISRVFASVDLRKLDVYNMGGTKNILNAGDEQRAIVFVNSTRANVEVLEHEKLVFNGIELPITKTLKPVGNGLLIKSANEVVVAEYYRDRNQLHILFDLFGEYNVDRITAFEQVLNAWFDAHFKVLALRYSWKHSHEKDSMTVNLKRRMERALREEIDIAKDRLRQYEAYINDYKNKIKQNYDNLIRTRNQIEVDEGNLGKMGNEIFKQLDLIINHPKVDDLHIKDGVFTVFIPNVYAYDKHNRRYYIGNCRVQIKMENTEVKFFGDNPRTSYWTSRDPHPHVNGNSGGACLGNVASTIAELCSRNEIYALVMICIDFLENVNIDDPAGRRVSNWDMVDENGKVIRYGDQQPNAGRGEDDLVHEDDVEEDDDDEDYEGDDE